MAITRIETRMRNPNIRNHRLVQQIQNYLGIPAYGIEQLDVYWVETNTEVSKEILRDWAENILSDSILQTVALGASDFQFTTSTSIFPSFAIEVRYLPGVTDNIGKSATEALHLYSSRAKEENSAVYSGQVTVIYGQITELQAQEIGTALLGNSLIQEIKVFSMQDFLQEIRFSQLSVPKVLLENSTSVQSISLNLSDKQLAKLSSDNCWALSVEELNCIQNYFQKEDVRSRRIQEGLPENPTDVELEILAQTWSEHCKHKIFGATIEYQENFQNLSDSYSMLGTFKVDSIFKTYIKGATKQVQEERDIPWLVSIFSDNAGIVRFDKEIDLCIKVETHNSPSALDPYGGALTGIVGVNRDILGTGIGARPICNTDVFCFAPPNWPPIGEEKELPQGLKHPRRIFEGVHLGIEHGGNKSGIPTVNGAITFHQNFAGKPLVFCGTIGVLPQELPSGKSTAEKRQKTGNHVVMAGGRIGKDGIHGATFSSMELNSNAPATAVQIGDPITQKRLADFLLEARDLELFTSVTDNGAGGLSSSVGEMATVTNGATIDVAKAPTKYQGLAPFELVVSESQERMTFSVPEEKLNDFFSLAQKRNVEVCDLGLFTNDGFFRIQHQGKTVALIEMDFLHNGLPPMNLKADWHGPQAENYWSKAHEIIPVSRDDLRSRLFLEKALFSILASWNVRSKESLVRRYDHEVQAATVIKPFVGENAEGPSDAGVIWLGMHGGDKNAGISISCGLAPKYSRYDTYLMAQHAFDEAIRNAVAVGGDPDQVAVTDNFCWPDPLPSSKNPDAEHKLAQLVRANKGLFDIAVAYGSPFVSGKDSMKNDFIGKTKFGKDIKISVPPTVLVTAMAKVPKVTHTVTSDFKSSGDKVYILGYHQRELGASELVELFQLPEGEYLNRPPQVNMNANISLYRVLHQAIQKGMIRSCHDCSEGGIAIALVESALGGNLGLEVDLENCENAFQNFGGNTLEFLFNESPGRFIVSVAPEKEKAFLKHFHELPYLAFGEVKEEKIFRICDVGLVMLEASIAKLRSAWKGEWF